MSALEKPSYVKAAIASCAASMVLLLVTFTIPRAPLAPFLFGNWLLFMSVGYFAYFRPFRWRLLIEQPPDLSKLKAINLSLIVFTVAGWIAWANAERIT
jgi:hypothetical protein